MTTVFRDSFQRHACESPHHPDVGDPPEWRCPECGRVWELRHSVWYEPTERGLP